MPYKFSNPVWLILCRGCPLFAKQCYHSPSKSPKCRKCSNRFEHSVSDSPVDYCDSDDSGKLTLEVIMVCPFLLYSSVPCSVLIIFLTMIRKGEKMHVECRAWACSSLSSYILFQCLQFDEYNNETFFYWLLSYQCFAVLIHQIQEQKSTSSNTY